MTQTAARRQRPRQARRELGWIVVGDAHVAGPLAGEDGFGRLAGHPAEHDRHAATLSGGGITMPTAALVQLAHCDSGPAA